MSDSTPTDGPDGAPFSDPAMVERLARLARLELTEDEVARIGRELGEVLAYVDALTGVDTEGVEPTAFAGSAAPVRPEGLRIELTPGDATANAPDRDGAAFRVPKVL